MDVVGAHTETPTPRWSRDENSATGSKFNWDFFVRTGLLGEAVDALLNGPGVLLDGMAGSGRKTMAAAVLRQLQGKILLIDLGFPERHRTTFAFTKILDDLERQDEDARFQAISNAHSLLQQASAGLPVVVYVPESLVLGHRKSSFLSALALSNSVTLLCLNTMLPTAEPQGKDDLLGSVRLHRIRLNPLSLAETHQRMTLALGGEVSRAATYQIWQAAAGQLHLVSAVAQDWFDLGYLIKSEHGWIVGGDHRPVGPRGRAIWSHVVSGTRGAEREVLELLALTEEIPLGMLMMVCEAGPVDSVYAKGLVEIGGHFPRSIRLSKILNGSVVIDLTTPGRARELLAKFTNVHGNPRYFKPLIRLRWEQAAGEVSDDELVTSAAAQALTERRQGLCLQILEGHGISGAEGDLLRLEALVHGRHVEHANEILASLRARLGTVIPLPLSGEKFKDLAFMVRLATLEIALSAVIQDGGTLHPYAEFADLRQSIAAWKTVRSDLLNDLNLVSGRLDLSEAELLYHVGKELWAEDLPYNHPYLEADEQQRWQCLHNLHSIRRGRIRLALKRGSELSQMLRQDFTSAGPTQSLRQHLVDMYLISGEWANALELIEAAWIGGQDAEQRMTERSGLYSSLVHVFTGRNEQAISMLGIEIDQLRAFDVEGQLPLALAAAARAASNIDKTLARTYLKELERVPEGWSWDTRQGVLAFSAIAESNLGRFETASEMLEESAETNAARGLLNLELTSRVIKFRLGDRRGTEDLIDCARKIDGILADEVLSSLRDDGMDEHDARFQDLKYNDIGGATVHSRSECDALTSDEPEISVNGSAPGLVEREVSGHGQPKTGSQAAMLLRTLTARQRTIVAEVVVGASSRSISQKLNIGVRTVEGHIYQIYQRLHVSSRQQLAELYQQAQEATDEREKHSRPVT